MLIPIALDNRTIVDIWQFFGFLYSMYLIVSSDTFDNSAISDMVILFSPINTKIWFFTLSIIFWQSITLLPLSHNDKLAIHSLKQSASSSGFGECFAIRSPELLYVCNKQATTKTVRQIMCIFNKIEHLFGKCLIFILISRTMQLGNFGCDFAKVEDVKIGRFKREDYTVDK